MPRVKTNRIKYPEGWELIEPTLAELDAKMREAGNDSNDGKRKCEALWPIFKVAHQRSRYVYGLYYVRKEISKELYEFCLEQGYADRNLIAKWKKPGYERLCCLHCIQPRDHNFATTCACRVPKHLREAAVIECVHCGCQGCASGFWFTVILQVAIETVYVAVQTFIYSLLLFSMIGYQWTAEKFFYFYYFIFMCFTYFSMYAMMVVALTPGYQITAIVMSFFLSFWNLFSSILVPRPLIPVWWRWYYWASPVAWTIYGIFTSQVGDRTDELEIPGETVKIQVNQFLKEYLG